MKRTVSVEVSAFAIRALEGEEGKAIEHVPARLVRGIRYYLSERDSGRTEWPYPKFMRDREPSKLVELELSVEEDLWAKLEEEAGRQGIATRQLVEHAALFIASDVNAGRITKRILDGLDGEEDETTEKGERATQAKAGEEEERQGGGPAGDD